MRSAVLGLADGTQGEGAEAYGGGSEEEAGEAGDELVVLHEVVDFVDEFADGVAGLAAGGLVAGGGFLVGGVLLGGLGFEAGLLFAQGGFELGAQGEFSSSVPMSFLSSSIFSFIVTYSCSWVFLDWYSS